MTLLNQLLFVAKVVGLSTLGAIALKAFAPHLPLPATTAVSLVFVLSPAMVMGGLLSWQLWTSNHDDPAHSHRHQ